MSKQKFEFGDHVMWRGIRPTKVSGILQRA
jgi:hypothetical protein